MYFILSKKLPLLMKMKKCHEQISFERHFVYFYKHNRNIIRQ